MTKKQLTLNFDTVGEALVELLRLRGIDYIFGGAPTSMMEALAKQSSQSETSLHGVVTPHEQTAVAMAHGYYAATQRPQAVYLYSIVGTANGLGGIINAARARIPMIIISARSPISERRGVPGARDIHVQWAQESFDQAAMVREYVKWDYEVRQPEQVADVLDRALEVAMAEPRGPVYISVPRDVLAAPLQGLTINEPSRRQFHPRLTPDPAALDAAAELLAQAKAPVIVTAETGITAANREALGRLGLAGGIGVLEASPVYSNLSPDHPCHLGYVFASQVNPSLEQADVILALECDVPWFTARVNIPPSTRVIQAGVDPLYQHLPMRNFPCDVALIGHADVILNGLADRVEKQVPDSTRQARLEQHQARRATESQALDEAVRKDSERQDISAAWANHALAQLVDDDVILVNEYPVDLRIVQPQGAGSYFGPSHAGGLGWGMAAALGIQAAKPDATVICAVGDGSYHFSSPLSCHEVAASENLPILTVVFNNGGWNEVRKSVLSTHPDGHAAKAPVIPLTTFGSQARFEAVVEAFGGFGARVTDPQQLLPTLREALRVVREERRQALVNIAISA